MRVRTGRFVRLRSGESGNTQPLEVAQSQDAVERLGPVLPPTPAVPDDALCVLGDAPSWRSCRYIVGPHFDCLRCSARRRWRRHSSRSRNSPRLCYLQVTSPARQIRPQIFHRLFDTPAPAAPRQLPQTILVAGQRLGRDLAENFPAFARPQRELKKGSAAATYRRHRAPCLVDRQLQARVATAQ